MKRLVFGIVLALAGTAIASAQPERAYAFVDVNVAPMDSERVLLRQTVVTRGGTIRTLGPAGETAIPPDAVIIEGNGTAWLAPGLADMHTHTFEVSDLALFLAHGVTTVLDLGGDEPPPRLVTGLIERGELDGPRVLFSFLVNGEAPGVVVADGADAAAAARLAKNNGYHFVKVYNSLSEAAFAAIVEEAPKQGLGVIGHGVRAVGLPRGLELGQSMVAHAEEFFYTAFANTADYERMDDVAAAIAATGAYVTPNLFGFEVIVRQWGDPQAIAPVLEAPHAEALSPRTRLVWTEPRYTERTAPSQSRMREILDFLRAFTRSLDEANVPLLVGTDTPAIPGVFPGLSVHEEIRNLVESGLSRHRALAAATRVPGEFIQTHVPGAQRSGVVAEGARADLVLVAENPLENLQTLVRPVGTMTQGRWYSREALERLLETRRSLHAEQLRRVGAEAAAGEESADE